MATAQKPATAGASRRTITNWQNFVDAQLNLEFILGEGYKATGGAPPSPHRRDNGSHTRLDFKSGVSPILEEVKRQDVNGSGGGFKAKLRLNPKPWTGWKALEEAGIECLDIRSAVDLAKVVAPPFHPAQLQDLTRPMRDGNNRVRPESAGEIYITLGFGKPALSADELDEVA